MKARRPRVHLINPMIRSGGSEWRTINLYKTLRPHCRVTIWTRGRPDPGFDGYPVKGIDIRRLRFPIRGTFVFIGVYWPYGRWIWLAFPRRVVLMYNTPHSDMLRRKRSLLKRVFCRDPEMTFTSAAMRDATGLPGLVEPSLFDLDEFKPAERRPPQPFTIGRLSRASADKHHPDDPAFYLRLAAAGCRIKVMGASPTMLAAGSGHPAITLLPEAHLDAAIFLRGLDCFYFRTAPSWLEPWARVVSEAMACGLPVVAERRGGYAEIIDHGRNGFLFDTETEAFAIIMMLKRDALLRRAIGEAARRTIETLLSPAVRQDIVAFYLR